MNWARLIAAGIVLTVVGTVYLVQRLGADSCGASGTTEALIGLLQQNGRINFLPQDWVGETTVPQFASIRLAQAGNAESGAGFRCHAKLAVEYNPAYIKLLLGEEGRPYTGAEPLHRDFDVDYTPGRRGEGADQDLVMNYRLISH